MMESSSWGRPEYLLIAVWCIGLGFAAWRQAGRFAAWSVLTGFCLGMTIVGSALSLGRLAAAGTHGLVVALPVWIAWLAALIWRHRRERDS